MKILAIETSCDETAAAVVCDGREVCSSVVASQIEKHKEFGGVVPEIASRMHIENISAITEAALEKADCCLSDMDALAVTAYPGLIGALLVGVNFAKAAAFAANKPLVPVHHIKGHIAANYIAYPDLEPPFIGLVVSGGHTLIVHVKGYTEFELLGSSRDDAAGECFDKVARVLGLPYPGGVNLDKLSAGVTAQGQYSFPSPKVDGSPLDFSFSGLKTAAINILHNKQQKGEKIETEFFAADFSQAVSRELCSRVVLAVQMTGLKKVALAGGVAANSTLRAKMAAVCKELSAKLYIPPLELCGDNAAMIGCQGYYEYLAGVRAGSNLNAKAVKKIQA